MYPSVHKCDLCGGEYPCVEIHVLSDGSSELKDTCKGCLFKVAQESKVIVDILGIIKWKS